MCGSLSPHLPTPKGPSVTTPASTPMVAVINTSDDIADLLKTVIESEGYRVVVAFVREFRDGHQDLTAFLEEHDPNVIVWDIALPYEQNWQYYQDVRRMEVMQGRTFVVTTTNKRALDSLVGPTDTCEIIGKPFDLDDVMQAIQQAAPTQGGE